MASCSTSTPSVHSFIGTRPCSTSSIMPVVYVALAVVGLLDLEPRERPASAVE
jgi:hypothetical protein